MMILDRRMAILDLMQTPALPGFVSRQVVAARRYFLDLKPARQRPLSVVCGGYERVQKEYVVSRGDFPYLCVEFVAGGRGMLEVGGRRTPLGVGSVFAYGPGTPHVIRTDPRARLRKYYIDFVGREAAGRLAAARLPPGSHRTVSHAGELREIFELLQRCGGSQSTHSQPLCTQLLGFLLAKIAERGLPAGTVDLRAFDTFERFRGMLAAERHRLTSVERAAEEFGISAAYACRLFRRFASSSPYQYLLRQRMSLAAELLVHERLQVRQVADRLGFAEPAQFSRAFKRVTGVAPVAFQRQRAPGP
jgi:AraC-like DNA-binding protein